MHERCRSLAFPASSQRSLWNTAQHSTALWWESQIYQRRCQLYPDFQLYWGLNATSIPALHLSLSLRRSLLLSSFFSPPHTHWHNMENNARVPPHQTAVGETIRGTDRETENYSAGRNLIVHQSKTEGKNFLLNWLYIHEKKNHNVSLSLSLSLFFFPPSVFVCLMVPNVYTLPVSTFAHSYQSCFSGIKSSHTNTLYSPNFLLFQLYRKPTRFCYSEAQLVISKTLTHPGQHQPWVFFPLISLSLDCICGNQQCHFLAD